MKTSSSAFRQPKDSQWCGPACLAFIYNEFGLPAVVADVASELVISDEYGIGLFDLARSPLTRGLGVTLFAWDAQNFPITWHGMKRDAIMRDLEKKRPAPGGWRHALLHDLRLRADFKATMLTEAEIRTRHKRGERAVLYLNSAVLYQHADGIWGHYVVLLETGEKNWKIFDPHWKYGGVKSYPKELLLFAMWSVGSYGFWITKKKNSQRVAR